MNGIHKEILREIQKGNYGINYKYFELDKREFMKITEELLNEGLLRNAELDYTGGNYSDAIITQKGLSLLRND